MRRVPMILTVTTGILWAAAIAADAADTSDRIWRPLLSAAAAAAVISAVQRLLDRYARKYTRSSEALARAVMARPLYRDTGPLPRIQVVSQPGPRGEEQQPAQLSAHGRRHGRHESSR